MSKPTVTSGIGGPMWRDAMKKAKAAKQDLRSHRQKAADLLLEAATLVRKARTELKKAQEPDETPMGWTDDEQMQEMEQTLDNWSGDCREGGELDVVFFEMRD